jgi:hypothetical protein
MSITPTTPNLNPKKPNQQAPANNGWGPEIAAPSAPAPAPSVPAAGGGGEWGPEIGAPTDPSTSSVEPGFDPTEPDFQAVNPTLADKANAPLVSPDAIIKTATFGKYDRARLTGGINNLEKGLVYKNGRWIPVGSTITHRPDSQEYRDVERKQDMWKSQHIMSTLADTTANRVSSLTNPVGIGLAFSNKLGKIPGIGRFVRAAASGLGAGYALDAGSDLDQMYEIAPGNTPGEKLKSIYWDNPHTQERALNDAANILSGIPALHDIAKATAGVPQAITPDAYKTGERALVNALNPRQGRPAERVKAAYQVVAREMFKAYADPKSSIRNGFEGLRDWTREQMQTVARETTQRVRAANGGKPVLIDPFVVMQGIESSITKFMDYTRHPSAQTFRVRRNGQVVRTKIFKPTREEIAIREFANRVAENIIDQGLDIEGAEAMVQELNQRTGDFYAQSKAEQRKAIMKGDPIVAELALKNVLQGEIEKAVGNYKDLKQQYGAYKEIHENTVRRIDQEDKRPAVQSGPRRAMEHAAGAVAFAAGSHAGGLHGGLASSVAAYKLSQALADAYAQHMKNPERMIQRAAQGPGRLERFADRPRMQSGPLSLIQSAVQSNRQPSMGSGNSLEDAMNRVAEYEERRIMVLAPDGTRGTVPASQREKAMRKGYRILN